MRYPLAGVLLLGLTALSAVAQADRNDPTSPGTTTRSRDRARFGTVVTGSDANETPSPWQGSALLFDQSASTPTLGLGAGYQSSDQSYELWFALRPRYSLYQSENTTVSATLAANLYLEFTNSGSTTTEHEPQLGPTLFSVSLSRTLFKSGDSKTSFNIGPRVTLPTDRESRAMGRYFSAGASAGLSQSIPINGKDASAFNSLRFSVSSIYGHAFNRAVVPTNSSVEDLPRQVLKAPRDVELNSGRLVAAFGGSSDQLRSGMSLKDSLSVSVSGNAQLTPKLNFGLMYLISNSWTYWPTSEATIPTPTGFAAVQGISDPTNRRVSTWTMASLDYDAFEEASVGVGYYNQTGQLGPDGVRRNPFWSPEARIFLTLSGNLDVIFEKLGQKPVVTQTAAMKP